MKKKHYYVKFLVILILRLNNMYFVSKRPYSNNEL